MPKKAKRTRKPRTKISHDSAAVTAADVVEQLRSMGSQKAREGMARFAITSDRAFGIPVGEIRALAKSLRGPRVPKDQADAARRRNHALARDLWNSGWYEARMLACFVDEPTLVTPAQMDRWARDFDNWAICDTACFHLFDKTPHAMSKVVEWAARDEEFVKRGAFAIIASVALHNKKATDDIFAEGLRLAEYHADDARNFVKKAISWALRGVGARRPTLTPKVLKIAERLAASDNGARRWVGKDVLREFNKMR
ncbi:MAG: DNA alkylation repair protein [Phycisphaerales bacterium]